jgi:hypothetical protein
VSFTLASFSHFHLLFAFAFALAFAVAQGKVAQRVFILMLTFASPAFDLVV